MPLPPESPEAIEAESFAAIDREAGPDRPFHGRAWEIARRLVHSTADFAILPDLRLPDAAIDAGIAALRSGAPLFTDTEMARCGMTRRPASFGVRARCLLGLPGVADRAAQSGGTRARAAVELAADLLPGAIVAVGNAPTALLALLDLARGGMGSPALIVAMPVGFVNAAESKDLCVRFCADHGIPCLALLGRKGGSALAAATINALAVLAERTRACREHERP